MCSLCDCVYFRYRIYDAKEKLSRKIMKLISRTRCFIISNILSTAVMDGAWKHPVCGWVVFQCVLCDTSVASLHRQNDLNFHVHKNISLWYMLAMVILKENQFFIFIKKNMTWDTPKSWNKQIFCRCLSMRYIRSEGKFLINHILSYVWACEIFRVKWFAVANVSN